MANSHDHEDEILTNPGSDDPLLPEGQGPETTRTQTMIVETRTMLRVRKVRLAVIAGPQAGRELCSERERIRLGSAPSCDLVLNDRTVSRVHSEIQLTERGYLLVDADSTNGTLLDGRQIERAYLAPGSSIKIGSSVITFNPVDEEIPIEADHGGQLGEMIGHSLAMRQTFGLIRKIAPMDVTVLVTGETGTGKELVAKALHNLSPRSKAPLVVLDCAAIPPTLIESELFGHERGAFTGADKARAGAFERANGGTIFLDELGELRLDLQPRLLRVLENRELRRLGGEKTLPIDVRVIAATNRDLQKEILANNFREDLYFRLSVINVAIPPLRERRDDILNIVEAYLQRPTMNAARGHLSLDVDFRSALLAYDWPGNIRELLNVIERAAALGQSATLSSEDLPERLRQTAKLVESSPDAPRLSRGEGAGDNALEAAALAAQAAASSSALPAASFKQAKEDLLERFERDYLTRILAACDGNLSEAARRSGLHRKSIERLARKYGL